MHSLLTVGNHNKTDNSILWDVCGYKFMPLE